LTTIGELIVANSEHGILKGGLANSGTSACAQHARLIMCTCLQKVLHPRHRPDLIGNRTGNKEMQQYKHETDCMELDSLTEQGKY
jgi:hypothetical protein